MKQSIFTLLLIVLVSCESKQTSDKSTAVVISPLLGTWQLISGTTIQGKDTTTTEYSKDKKFIKIINETHFAFVGHDLNKGKDTATAFYSSGGGTYSLSDSNYTEHLQYCSDRNWEGTDFNFKVSIHNDSLTQTGIEKLENLHIDRLNIEHYVRVK